MRERDRGGDFVRVLSMTRLLDTYGNEKQTYTAAVMCATAHERYSAKQRHSSIYDKARSVQDKQYILAVAIPSADATFVVTAYKVLE